MNSRLIVTPISLMPRFQEISQRIPRSTRRLFSWKSKKQKTMSLSFAKAEYRSIRKVVGELVCLRRFLVKMTIPFSDPTPVFFDSQAASILLETQCFMNKLNILR